MSFRLRPLWATGEMGAIGVVAASTVWGPCRIGSNDRIGPTGDLDSPELCAARDLASASRELEGGSRSLEGGSCGLGADRVRSWGRGAGSCELGPAGWDGDGLVAAGGAVGVQPAGRDVSVAGGSGGCGWEVALGGCRGRSSPTGAGGDGPEDPELL